jgi:hypothetical protein
MNMTRENPPIHLAPHFVGCGYDLMINNRKVSTKSFSLKDFHKLHNEENKIFHHRLNKNFLFFVSDPKLVPDDDPENAKHEFAFDNPAFKGEFLLV